MIKISNSVASFSLFHIKVYYMLSVWLQLWPCRKEKLGGNSTHIDIVACSIWYIYNKLGANLWSWFIELIRIGYGFSFWMSLFSIWSHGKLKNNILGGLVDSDLVMCTSFNKHTLTPSMFRRYYLESNFNIVCHDICEENDRHGYLVKSIVNMEERW